MSGPIAGAMQTQVLAPDAVTRLGGQATEVRTDVWEVTMGASVAAFVISDIDMLQTLADARCFLTSPSLNVMCARFAVVVVV